MIVKSMSAIFLMVQMTRQTDSYGLKDICGQSCGQTGPCQQGATSSSVLLMSAADMAR
jgi:hypothetical protein